MSDIEKVIARVRMTRFAGYSEDILDARQLADHITDLQAKLDAVEEYYRILEAKLAAGYMVCDKHPYLTTTSPTASALGCPYCKLDAVKEVESYSIELQDIGRPATVMLTKDVLKAIGEQE